MPDGDDRPTRLSVWAVLSIVSASLSLAVCLLIVLVALFTENFDARLVGLLLDLLSLLGLYAALTGIVCHFVARRRIAASACASDFRIEGDFTAIIGFALSLLCWCFLQISSHLGPRWGSAVLATMGLPMSWAESVAELLDISMVIGLILIGLLYILVSGPPVAKLLTPLLLILFPVLLLFSGMLAGREDARRTLLQHRLGRVGRGFIQQQDVQRDLSPQSLPMIDSNDR